MKDNKKNTIVILGAGESGVGSAVLAIKKGFDVFVSDYGQIKNKYKQVLDKQNILWEEGKHTEEVILQAVKIIKSPGIPDTAPIVKKALEKNIPVISEIEFAYPYSSAKHICITGSNGKTTTTSIIYYLLKNAGLNVGLGGNIGKSYALQVANENYDYYVLELSSFQLDGMFDFKADMAILMNITPDHLDRYNYEMERYVDSKFRVVKNMTSNDLFIYCADDKEINEKLKKLNITACTCPFSLEKTEDMAAYKEEMNLKVKYSNNEFMIPIKDLSLKGRHNTYNSMAAAIVANVLEIRKDVIRNSLMNFQGVEHRLEPVIKVRGIEFINDSKATNINSSWYALESMVNPTIWIVGGIDKGNDYSELTDLVGQKVKAIVCLGKDNTKIIRAFKGKIETIIETQTMEDAVKSAYYLGKKGDAVLLSPACASFDLFDNYEDRGRQFKQAVRNL